ncbi:MAG: methyltransferase domain-containing protein [Actinomycetota bacterium]
MPANAREHYNHVTDSWKEFMGDNLHFGYFETEDMELARATDLLIEKLLELSDINADSHVLDVGCGIGNPAFYIYDKLGCSIDGISTSERGVQLASTTARERGYDGVNFRVADGVANGFPDGSFDVVWIMEASHLFRDKRALFRECHRVLKAGGTFALCDVTQAKLLPMHKGVWHFLKHLPEYYQLMKAFGPAQVITLGDYCNLLIEAGFNDVTTVDISRQALPTMTRWKENAMRYARSGGDAFAKKDVDIFIRGCEIDEAFMQQGIYGYGMVRAVKRG